MRKNFLWILLIILVAAMGGGYVLWMTQASQARHAIEATVNDFNTGPVKLTYDAIETTGFPTKLVINIVNPKFSGRMDVLLDPNKQRNLPEWTESAALNGVLQLEIDALSSHAAFTMTGGWKNTSTLNGQSVSIASKNDFQLQCALTLERPQNWLGSLWNPSVFRVHGADLMKDFRLVDCMTGDMAFVETASSAVLFQNGPQRLYVSSDPVADKHQVRFYMKGTDALVTPDGDRIYAIYSRAFSPQVMPAMLSAYGKQNLEIDFSYTGPLEWKNDPRSAPVDIHLGRFLLTNDAYNLNAEFILNNAVDTQNQSARVAFKTQITYNQIYNALAHETVRSIISQFFANPQMSPAIPQGQTPESLYALMAPAIPDFYKLNKTIASLDVAFQGSPGFGSGEFTLADLELSAAPYGLTGKGNGKRVAGALMPIVNVSLLCRNCLQMVDDLIGFANRIHDISIVLSPGKPTPAFDAAAVQGYKSFLQALATDDGAGNYSYAIINDGKSGITINNRRFDEVLMLYHKAMPQPQR